MECKLLVAIAGVVVDRCRWDGDCNSAIGGTHVYERCMVIAAVDDEVEGTASYYLLTLCCDADSSNLMMTNVAVEVVAGVDDMRYFAEMCDVESMERTEICCLCHFLHCHHLHTNHSG